MAIYPEYCFEFLQEATTAAAQAQERIQAQNQQLKQLVQVRDEELSALEESKEKLERALKELRESTAQEIEQLKNEINNRDEDEVQVRIPSGHSSLL